MRYDIFSRDMHWKQRWKRAAIKNWPAMWISVLCPFSPEILAATFVDFHVNCTESGVWFQSLQPFSNKFLDIKLKNKSMNIFHISGVINEIPREYNSQCKMHILQNRFQLLSITGMSFASTAQIESYRFQLLILRTQTDMWGKHTRNVKKNKNQSTNRAISPSWLPEAAPVPQLKKLGLFWLLFVLG